MIFKEDVKKYLDIELSDTQMFQFDVYYNYLITYNQTTNLTRITEEQEVYYKHFFDSLSLAKTINFNKVEAICDMGAGAGFPSIPLKIVFPHLKVTIVDSLNKRIVFLTQLIERLNVTHVELVHDRVENFALSHQELFDFVTARALGHLTLITEMGLPMVKLGGVFLGLKSQNFEEELKESKHAITKLGGKIKDIHQFDLPHHYGQRVHINIEKIKHVKGFPRSYAHMTKKPL